MQNIVISIPIARVHMADTLKLLSENTEIIKVSGTESACNISFADRTFRLAYE